VYGATSPVDPDVTISTRTWLAPYRQMWTHHLAALERHLDDKEQQ
jgi:hypothetical protein